MEILARAVGRRKEAVAQVQIVRGTGKFIINNKSAQDYLQNNSCSLISVKAPLNCLSDFDFVSASLSSNGEIGKTSTKVWDSTNNQAQIDSTIAVSNRAFHSPSTEQKSNGQLSADAIVSEQNVSHQQEHSMTLCNTFSKNLETMDTIVKVKGGGLIGQAEAIKLAVARALCLVSEWLNLEIGEFDARKPLKNKGYLTQDSRVKERRKYGLKKARKASQYHKR